MRLGLTSASVVVATLRKDQEMVILAYRLHLLVRNCLGCSVSNVLDGNAWDGNGRFFLGLLGVIHINVVFVLFYLLGHVLCRDSVLCGGVLGGCGRGVVAIAHVHLVVDEVIVVFVHVVMVVLVKCHCGLLVEGLWVELLHLLL